MTLSVMATAGMLKDDAKLSSLESIVNSMNGCNHTNLNHALEDVVAVETKYPEHLAYI